jgi:microcystin-dependent protein
VANNLSITKQWADGEILLESDLDYIKNDTETFVNITGLNDDNIQNNGITGSDKLVDGSISTAKLANSAVTTAKIADGAVTTAKILDANVTYAKLAADVIAAVIPPGSVWDFCGSSLPSGWLFCDGSAVSRTTYAALFTAIGTSYGSGNGSTTFNVPDSRGRVTVGRDNMGGSSASRMTSTTMSPNGTTLGATGGTETHALTPAQLAAHTHTFSATTSAPSATVLLNAGGNSVASAGHTHTVSGTTTAQAASGSNGTAHLNVQPSIIVNKMIRT